MARENPSWGYTRLRGALENLGLHLGRSTIQRRLKEHGIEPAPLRGKTMSWKTFLKAHWGAIAAADFFSVEVLTLGGLVRYLVLFVMDVKTRRVHVAGVTCRADRAWMAQVARNLTDAVAGPLQGFGYLIVDRDPLYTVQARSVGTNGLEDCSSSTTERPRDLEIDDWNNTGCPCVALCTLRPRTGRAGAGLRFADVDLALYKLICAAVVG